MTTTLPTYPARGAILESYASRCQSQSVRGFYVSMSKITMSVPHWANSPDFSGIDQLRIAAKFQADPYLRNMMNWAASTIESGNCNFARAMQLVSDLREGKAE